MPHKPIQKSAASTSSTLPLRITAGRFAVAVLFVCLALFQFPLFQSVANAAEGNQQPMRSDGEQLEVFREMSMALAAAPLKTVEIDGFRVEIFHEVPGEYTRGHVRDVPANISLKRMESIIDQYSAASDSEDDDLIFYTAGTGYGDLPIGYAFMDGDEPYASKPLEELGRVDGPIIAHYMDNFLVYNITTTELVSRSGANQQEAAAQLQGRRILVNAKIVSISEDGKKADFTVAMKGTSKRAEIGCSLSEDYNEEWIADDDLKSVRPGDMLDISGILRSVNGYNISLEACLPYTVEDGEFDEDY